MNRISLFLLYQQIIVSNALEISNVLDKRLLIFVLIYRLIAGFKFLQLPSVQLSRSFKMSMICEHYFV